MNLTIQNIQQAYAKYNYILSDFNIFGVRYFDNLDLFTDVRAVLYKKNGAWEVFQIPQTTKPSIKALTNPVNSLGCAILKSGQYVNCWKIGLHEGHDALVQCGTVTVYRDNQKTGTINFSACKVMPADPSCGINIHGVWASNIPGWDGTYPKVDACGDWSEVCQVAARPSEHAAFMALCREANLNRYTYTLFDINDFQNT